MKNTLLGPTSADIERTVLWLKDAREVSRRYWRAWLVIKKRPASTTVRIIRTGPGVISDDYWSQCDKYRAELQFICHAFGRHIESQIEVKRLIAKLRSQRAGKENP